MIYELNLKLQSIFSLSQQRKLSKINKQHKETGREIEFSGRGLETAYFIFKTSTTQRLENNTERKKINWAHIPFLYMHRMKLKSCSTHTEQ